MKYLYNKETMEGQWFSDIETNTPDDTSGYTEKKPPDTSYVWNEEQNEWLQFLINQPCGIEGYC